MRTKQERGARGARYVGRTILLAMLIVPMFALSAVDYPAVERGFQIDFPRDEGSHPQFRTEWWYVTGWLEDEQGRPLGFQITFFRTRPGTQEDNPSRFAAKQVLFAHAAISDPRRERLLLGERAAREGFGLAYAKQGELGVAIDDWSLEQVDSDSYRTRARAEEFSFDLRLDADAPPLLQGDRGFSQKGPSVQSASYYYSRPQLQVTGTLRTDAGVAKVRGRAWMDHEWSSEFLESGIVGWDWIGINLHDGGALMVSRMRGADGSQRWGFGTLRTARGVQTFSPGQIEWTPQRRWISPRTGIEYPIEWRVRIGDRMIRLRPLFDDQESDTRSTTGTIYWEGAVTAFDDSGREIGRGYLELTGYGERLRF